MASTLLVVATVGIGFGVFLQKSRFCFGHAFRDLFTLKDSRVTRGAATATLLTMVFWCIECDKIAMDCTFSVEATRGGL